MGPFCILLKWRIMFKISWIFILASFLLARDLEVNFLSNDDWLSGRSWGGQAFYNSIDYGSAFIGSSSLEYFNASDIDIHLSQHPDSVTHCWVYSSVNPELVLGMGTFPGTVYDVSNPNFSRRLNLIFFEEENGDLHWNPESLSDGDREYLMVMYSDYDSTGLIYENTLAYNQDVQYFCWLKRQIGSQWFQSEPASLEFRNYWTIDEFELELGNGSFILNWAFELPEVELQEIQYYQVYRGASENQLDYIADIDLGVNFYEDNDVIIGNEYYYQLKAIDLNDVIIIETEILSGQTSLQSFNTTLLNNWNNAHENLLVDYGPKTYNDIWGYTDQNGYEYALIGTWDGTHIVNISSDPIEEVAFVPGSFSTHRDIKTFDNFMYIGTEANMPDPYLLNDEYFIEPQGVQVIDISNPSDPVELNEWDGVVQSHNIMEADGYLYVIGSNDLYSNDGMQESWGIDDLIILDLENNPSSPVKVGGWSGEYLHDVCIDGDILYGCAIYSNSMMAFDISDKTNPTLIQEWSGIQKAHACWVSEDSNYLFTASETAGGYVISWDVSDLNNISYLDEWLPEGAENYSVHNIFVKDNYLYMSYYIFGLQIIDISDPYNLSMAGFYDTYRQTGDLYTYDGAWGTYPYFSSDKIVVSDRQSGLYVIDFILDNNFLLGDVNGDNNIDIFDVIIIVEFILNTESPDDQEFTLSDINLDQTIDVLDILMIIEVILS